MRCEHGKCGLVNQRRHARRMREEHSLTYAILAQRPLAVVFVNTHCAWIVAMYATLAALQNAVEHVVTSACYHPLHSWSYHAALAQQLVDIEQSFLCNRMMSPMIVPATMGPLNAGIMSARGRVLFLPRSGSYKKGDCDERRKAGFVVADRHVINGAEHDPRCVCQRRWCINSTLSIVINSSAS